jgi:hypothetical protein
MRIGLQKPALRAKIGPERRTVPRKSVLDEGGRPVKTTHAVVLGMGLVVAALVFGMFHYSSRAARDTVSVVGAATQRFDSDMVKWKVSLMRITGLDDVARGYRLLERDLAGLKAELREAGVPEKDISIQPINSMTNYDQGSIAGYRLQQGVYVISRDIDAIEGLALNPADLVEKGMVFDSSRLEYFYSEISDLKMELLAQATLDARRRAEEIAGNSGSDLGKVTSLRAGVFQIREPFSTEVSDYGMYQTQTREKDITVTVRATFLIE